MIVNVEFACKFSGYEVFYTILIVWNGSFKNILRNYWMIIKFK